MHLGSVIVRKRNSGVDKIRNALATTIREKRKSQSVTVCQFLRGLHLLCKQCRIMMHFPTTAVEFSLMMIPLTLIFIQQFREKKWDSHLMIILWSQPSLGLWLQICWVWTSPTRHLVVLTKPAAKRKTPLSRKLETRHYFAIVVTVWLVICY